mgnify:FL=1
MSHHNKHHQNQQLSQNTKSHQKQQPQQQQQGKGQKQGKQGGAASSPGSRFCVLDTSSSEGEDEENDDDDDNDDGGNVNNNASSGKTANRNSKYQPRLIDVTVTPDSDDNSSMLRNTSALTASKLLSQLTLSTGVALATSSGSSTASSSSSSGLSGGHSAGADVLNAALPEVELSTVAWVARRQRQQQTLSLDSRPELQRAGVSAAAVAATISGKIPQKELPVNALAAVCHDIVLVDFECTCEAGRNPGFAYEIIEFPAILIDARTLLIKDVFHTYIKPSERPQLSE